MKFLTILIFIFSINTLLAQKYQLQLSSFIGGSNTDAVECITEDNNGNIYIYGYTNSKNFPTTLNSFQRIYGGGGSDLFVMKLNMDKEIVWSTLIGGSDVEYPKNIKFFNDYLWIVSDSRSTDFPISQDAFQKSIKSDYDGVLMKFSLDGDILYSSYLGSSGYDVIDDIVIDNDENIWVTGRVYGSDFYTTLDAEQKIHLEGVDSFISKFNKNGQVIYSSYLSGNGDDFSMDIAINRKSNIIAVTGYTNSSDFPIIGNALFPTKIENNLFDTFVSFFNLDGKLIWSSYFGGAGKEYGEHITSDNDSSFYIRSFTNSPEIMTVGNTFLKVNPGNFSSYIAKINTSGEFIWGSFVGGSSSDAVDNINNKGGDISINSRNEIAISGFTNSPDFPVSSDALYKSKGNGNDCFFTKFDADGKLLYSSFLGGNQNDEGRAVMLTDNKIYVAGWTDSDDFPTTANAISVTKNGGRDGFLAIFEPAIPCNVELDSDIGFTNLNLLTNKINDDDSMLRLNTLNSFDVGYVFNKNKLNLADGFKVEFSFIISNGLVRIVPVPGVEGVQADTSLPGADGIALVLSGELPTKLGGEGGKIGYGGYYNAMAIEIDLYQNSEYLDPDGNHIAIQIPHQNKKLYPHHNSESTLAISSEIPIIKSDSSEVYFCKVEYYKNNLRVYLDNSRTFGVTVIDLYNISLTDYLDLEFEKNGFMGFTTATGQSVELHDILDWEICTNGGVITSYSESRNNSDLMVYPNPTDDILHLKFDKHIDEITVLLTDIIGKTVFKTNKKLIGELFDVNINNLSTGAYSLSVYSNGVLIQSSNVLKR